MESSFLVERGCIREDATPFSMSRTDRRRSVDLDLGGCGFGFVAQCVEVGVERVVADDDAHAAVELGRGLAENAQVGVLLAADLLFAPVTRLFPACDRREDDGAGAGVFERDARDRQAEYGAAVQFEFVEILRTGKRHHTRVVRTRRQLREVDALVVAEEELHAPQSMPA